MEFQNNAYAMFATIIITEVSTEVQNNTNIITAAVTFMNIYISMKAVMILLFR